MRHAVGLEHVGHAFRARAFSDCVPAVAMMFDFPPSRAGEWHAAKRQRPMALSQSHCAIVVAANHRDLTMYSATIGARRYTLRRSRRRCWPRPRRCAAAISSPALRQRPARSASPRSSRSPTCRSRHSSHEHVVPYEIDEVTRLIVDSHDRAAFAPIAHLTVGGFRDWLLSDEATTPVLAALAPGVTPEMAAAVSKISRAAGPDADGGEMLGGDALPQHASGCPAGCRCGCSPTIRPTIRAASPRASSTACCSARATP